MSNPNGDGEPDDDDDFQEELIEVEQAQLEISIAKENLDLVIGWIAHADLKASLYLTISLALTGASLTEIPMLVKVCKQSPSIIFTLSLIVVHLAFYGFVIRAAFVALSVIKPRLAPDSNTHSWYFFQSVATFDSADKFRTYSHELSDEARANLLIDQIWNTSRVAKEKYERAGKADFWLRLSALFGMIAVTVTLTTQSLWDK